jgi:hypothetical protein
MKKNIKTIHLAISNKGTEFFKTNIVEYNENKFKIIYENRNGIQGVSVMIMTKDGDFTCVLSRYEIPYVFKASYVSDEDKKISDSIEAMKFAENIIKKIY